MPTPQNSMPPSSSELPVRRVRIGGVAKTELLSLLHEGLVHLNPAALELFADDRFTTSRTASVVETVTVSVAHLGLGKGGTYSQILQHAAAAGLAVCPLELAPHLRLQFTDQPEGALGLPPSQHRAPPGSITVASDPIANDDDTPKGFYLRRIDGALWLRGYRSWPGHVWEHGDLFVFALSPNAA